MNNFIALSRHGIKTLMPKSVKHLKSYILFWFFDWRVRFYEDDSTYIWNITCHDINVGIFKMTCSIILFMNNLLQSSQVLVVKVN